MNLIPEVANRDGEDLRPEHGSEKRGEPERFLEEGEEPSNFPDKERNNSFLVFLHGFNVDGQKARGWQSEIFKRLYWSGFKDRFVGVSWYGFEDTRGITNVIPNYYSNVTNAFETASILGQHLNAVVGDNDEISFMAHSLGNMVVSSYLSDYRHDPSLNIKKYLLFNAAVALEAYLGDYTSYATPEENIAKPFDNNNPMIHSKWFGYNRYLGSSEWYQLFDKSDPRSKLTWRNRFYDLPIEAIEYVSFYSSGEDVLATYEGDFPEVEFPDMWNTNWSRNAWVLQEKWKGRPKGIGGTDFMGWGFNDVDDEYASFIDGGNIFAANSISRNDLKTKPFFCKPQLESDEYILFDPNNNPSDYISIHRDQLLADYFPALTKPVGGSAGEDFVGLLPPELQVIELIDMNVNVDNDSWPRERKEWQHSDLREVALPFVYKVFDQAMK